MGKWKPIETAPKDGTLLLLFVPNDGWGDFDERDGDLSHPNITLGAYDTGTYQSAGWKSAETYTEFWDYGGLTGAGTSTYSVECSPSHWMPLPQPPSEGE